MNFLSFCMNVKIIFDINIQYTSSLPLLLRSMSFIEIDYNLPILMLKDICVISSFWLLQIKFYELSHTNHFVDIYFHFSLVSTWEWNYSM